MHETVRGWAREARHIAVLTGAGMSAESGVPTFRDAQTGFWSRFNPQDLATEIAFRAHPQRVWDWYVHRREMIAAVQPNAGHRSLASFAERRPGCLTLITQNVDGLHQLAGQTDALALHGNIADDQWLDAPLGCCSIETIEPDRPPRCPVCGNLRRPAVVWFGESLPGPALESAEHASRHCDLMLVVGTSGAVYPAAGLAFTAHQSGARVVVINLEPTPLDVVADVCLKAPAAVCLPTLLV